MIKANTDDCFVLGRTIFGEARGEPWEGKVAVAHVVANRLAAAERSQRLARLYGGSIAAVCTAPQQFSCWNRLDPNYRQIQAARLDDDPAFRACLGAACAVLGEAVPDPTFGATHYHAGNLKTLPLWARDKTPCAWIGKHVFYNNIEED